MKQLITLIALSMSCAAANAEWFPISKDSDIQFYGDATTRQWEGTRVKAWILANYKAPQTYQNKTFSSLKVQHQFDCKAQLERSLYAATFSNPMGNGNVLMTQNSPNVEWAPIVPGSIVAAIARWACAK